MRNGKKINVSRAYRTMFAIGTRNKKTRAHQRRAYIDMHATHTQRNERESRDAYDRRNTNTYAQSAPLRPWRGERKELAQGQTLFPRSSVRAHTLRLRWCGFYRCNAADRAKRKADRIHDGHMIASVSVCALQCSWHFP